MNIENPKFIYLLASDSYAYRDNIILSCAFSAIDDNMKKTVIDRIKDYYGNSIIEDTFTVEEYNNKGFLHFKYKSIDGDIESGQYGFLKIPLV
jgi:hypothetical protein